jgi:hypothetical protein
MPSWARWCRWAAAEKARFDGGKLSSEGGLVALCEIKNRSISDPGLLLTPRPRRAAARRGENATGKMPVEAARIGGDFHPFGCAATYHLRPSHPTSARRTNRPATRSDDPTRDIPPTPVLRAMDTQATRASPLTPVRRAMDTRADRCTLPTPGPVMDTPWLAIPATVPRRSDRRCS